MKSIKIKTVKAKKKRIVWGFNPSPKVVPNKHRKILIELDKKWKEELNGY